MSNFSLKLNFKLGIITHLSNYTLLVFKLTSNITSKTEFYNKPIIKPLFTDALFRKNKKSKTQLKIIVQLLYSISEVLSTNPLKKFFIDPKKSMKKNLKSKKCGRENL